MNATPTLQRWSTDAVAPGHRLDYWIGAVCEGFLEMDVRSTLPGFQAELVSAPLGAIALNAVRGSGQDVYRTGRGIAHSAQNFYYLLCKTDEAWTAAQGECRARLLPGDLLLVDSRRPYEFHFPTACTTASLELPTDWLERWLPDAGAHTGQRIDGQGGFGAALSAFVRQLQPAIALAPPLPAAVLTDQLGALLALGVGAPPPAPAPRGLRERIAACIRERHGEPGLTAADVAAQLGIGERSLHRALAAGGQAFAPLLMACRMDSARRLLGDARFDRLGVGEIGRRVGLLDASHFVRVFRRHGGLTPAAWRRQRGH
jgi:AraC family transcriptional activator of tynA and feaB